jgi:hypothetical protein
VHPDLSLPVRCVHVLVACLTFEENPTLASSPYAISSAVDVDHFRLFVNAINGAPLRITDGNIADLSSLAIALALVRLLREVDVDNLRLPVARWATWDRDDARTLIINLTDTSLPGRDEIPIMNLTRSLRKLVAHRSVEVNPAPHSTARDRHRGVRQG